PPFVAYMIRELFYNRTPIFHSNGEQKRDYIYIDDLIELAIAVQNSEGFDVVNVSSNKNYSVNEMYELTQKIMNKSILAKYADDSHYWEKYPELFEGKFPIRKDILNHEINKYTLCENTYAKNKYNWAPKVSLEEGLAKLIEEECKLLKLLGKKI
ncbi:GDP-mannose 4,6-dehydratase, partial [Fusobacterium polymorphum]